MTAPAYSAQRPPSQRLAQLAGWPMLALVVGVLVLRYLPPTGNGGLDYFTQVVVVATPWLGFPAIAAVIAAVVSRRPKQSIATAVVVTSLFAAIAPVDAVVGCRPGASIGEEIRIYSANVWAGEGRAAGIGSAIVEQEVDVVALQEVRPVFFEELLGVAGMERFPHSLSGDPDDSGDGVVILSRWPLGEISRDVLGGRVLISADIESPEGTFRFYSVHTTAPTNQYRMASWHEQLKAIGELPTATPAIIAGDFNATEDHQPFRELLNIGWTDAHDDKGCGADATWPVNRGVIPRPFARIDHVLMTDDFSTRSLRLGNPHGSDHVPLIAEVRLDF